MQLRRLFTLPFLFGLVFLLGACGEPDPIRIGFLGGVSGRVADLGVGGRNGAQLAIEAHNKAGGVDGRRLILVVKDDGQDPEQAKKAMREFAQAGIRVVIGPMTSSMAVAVVPLADELGIVLVSPTATTHALAGKDDNFFRVISDSREYARRSAEYHLAKTDIRRVAAIQDLRNRAYTEDWLAAFTDRFERGGGKLIKRLDFESGAAGGLRALAEAALASKPDAVLLLANSVDAGLLTQHLRSLNIATRVMTSEWAATERYIELSGAAAEGVVAAQFFKRDSTEPAYVAFREAFRQRYGLEPGFPGVAGHDAAKLALRGLTGSLAEPRKAMREASGFVGLQGPIAIDRFGDAVRPTYITVVDKGQFKALE